MILFLLLSFAPFTVVARFIGPFINRVNGGQRAVMFGAALLRAVLMVGMVSSIKSLSLFPLAFGALVLSKTYSISKSSMVSSVVTGDARLVEANSKLAKVAGIVGFVVGVPAFLLQMISTSVTLYGGAVMFLLAAFQAWHLPKSKQKKSADAALEYDELHSGTVLRAAHTMRFLRGAVGFMFFHLAFWLRSEIAGTAWFALALGIGSLSTLVANSLGGLVRRVLREHVVLEIALVVVAVVGLVAAYVGSITAGIVLTGVIYAVGALGKLAFDSILQSRAPDANRSRAFARYETRNQLAQVAGGFVAVGLTPSGPIGFAIIGSIGLVAAIYYAVRY